MEGGPEGRQTTSSVLCSCSFFFSSEHFFACLFKFKKNVVYIFCRIKNRCLILHPFVYDEESAIQSIFPTHDVCTDKRITPSIDPSHIRKALTVRVRKKTLAPSIKSTTTILHSQKA